MSAKPLFLIVLAADLIQYKTYRVPLSAPSA